MSEEKKFQLTTGNWITIGVFLIGIISAWAKIQVHISDESIHLTEQQRVNITTFTAITTEKLPNIKENHEDIELLKTDFAVFKTEFNFLYEEVDGLESKVSRNYVELRDKLEE